MNSNANAAMRWHVLGAGAIGGLWAARLALADYPVTLLLKDRERAAALGESPLRLETAGAIESASVAAAAAADPGPDIEWLLVTTKSYATVDALRPLRPRLSPATKILLLQNGIGVQRQVAALYPRCQVIAGVTTDGAWRRAPSHVVFAGRGETRFGAVGEVSRASVDRLRRCLRRSGLDAAWVEDIWRPIWHEVAVNCCINALSAVRRCRNGELLESAETVDTMRGLAAEVRQVMAALELGFDFPGLFDEVIAVVEKTADNYSSMYQDVVRGERTEIEYINGFVCARGEDCGVPTPLNRELLDAVRALGGRQSARAST